MAIEVPRGLVEEILLGPPNDRRQLQDSPLLGDVWIAFAHEPDRPADLLITPYKTAVASVVARTVLSRIDRANDSDPNIAFLQGIVAATLYFDEVLRVVVPLTDWWQSSRVQSELALYMTSDKGPAKLDAAIDVVLAVARNWGSKISVRDRDRLSVFDRYIALAGLVLWARGAVVRRRRKATVVAQDGFADAVRDVKPETIAQLLKELLADVRNQPSPERLVFQISLNRRGSSALVRSVRAVKGDAARTLFSIKCDEITWAVVDSGVDGTHPAFLSANGTSRVQKSFDFTQFRRIVSLGNARDSIRQRNLAELAKTRGALPAEADRILRELAEDANQGKRINWPLAEEMVILQSPEPPHSDHGTHVAGIIGARASAQSMADVSAEECVDGLCPDINIYDFRVLAPTISDTEFAVIAALQYIRHLNDRHAFITIHGINLSLSIPHDVRNYACGRTPVCVECEQMVESGIVVVAAAGNLGYQSFETKDGAYEGYTALSLTDPGNADGVITVGSTHRYSPRTYGVSFFSSRGPTGDGRPKPDLVAPGERIRSSIPGGQWGDLDGTSMAAPHVSGAAAMLMARYSELIGQPRRIKRILCESATDLGRERNFQGHGMLDVLRALQSA